MQERGILRPGRGPHADIDGVSLGDPAWFLRGLDLDPRPSASVFFPSSQGSALEVARSLLDLGYPPGEALLATPLEVRRGLFLLGLHHCAPLLAMGLRYLGLLGALGLSLPLHTS